MLLKAIPVLHVESIERAKAHYCDKLGFRLQFEMHAQQDLVDPCYAGVGLDGIEFHISSFSGDAVAGGVINLVVDSVDSLYQSFTAKGIEIDTPPVDQTWGTREMYVKDPDRNTLRFIQYSK